MNIELLIDRLREPNSVRSWAEADALMAEAAKAIEYLDAAGIHSCHPYCDNWACLLRRENETLKAALSAERVAIQAVIKSLDRSRALLSRADVIAAIKEMKP